MNFDFISDTKLKEILGRDFLELEICLENAASKAVLILSGSIVEAILVDYFINHVPKNMSGQEILRCDLHRLIELAFSEKIISSRTKELSTILRNYRNLIHPGREVRDNEKFDIETAKIAVSLLKIVSGDLEDFLANKYAYRAEDVILKLEIDETSGRLFRALIQRISQSERRKLFFLLQDYKPGRKESQKTLAGNKKSLIRTLKPFLREDFILAQLKSLVTKVQTSSSKEIIPLFGLLSKDLNLLTVHDQEIVVLYLINYLKYHLPYPSTDEFAELYYYYGFLDITNYLKSENLVSKFKQLLSEIILSFGTNNNVLSLYLGMRKGWAHFNSTLPASVPG